MDCSPPGSSVHGFPRQEYWEWVASPFSRGSSWIGDVTHVSGTGRWTLYHKATREAHVRFLITNWSTIACSCLPHFWSQDISSVQWSFFIHSGLQQTVLAAHARKSCSIYCFMRFINVVVCLSGLLISMIASPFYECSTTVYLFSVNGHMNCSKFLVVIRCLGWSFIGVGFHFPWVNMLESNYQSVILLTNL